MRYSLSDWKNHPGRNPRMPFVDIGHRPRWRHERSRWIPHQGKREIARRLRQAKPAE